jgi:hypothetical protein
MSYLQPDAEQALEIHPRGLDVTVPTGDALLAATLNVPPGARAVVAIFAPAGRSRYDSPSCFFALVLEQSGLATLSLDGLDSPRGDEVKRVVDWLRSESFTSTLPIGLLAFGSEPSLAVSRVKAWLVSEAKEPRAAELASEYFVSRLFDRVASS